MPRAYIEMILSSKPVNRLCPLATILGSKLPCRSRGVSSSSSPKSPFSTLRPLPFRLFPLCCPAGSCFSYPRWSVSSACSARSRIAFVSCFSRPFSPMMSSGFLYPASIWSIRALSIAIGADSPLPMVGYTVPYTAPQIGPVQLDVVSTPLRDDPATARRKFFQIFLHLVPGGVHLRECLRRQAALQIFVHCV